MKFKRPLKPFKAAIWNKELCGWEGKPPKKFARSIYNAWAKAKNLKPEKSKKKHLTGKQKMLKVYRVVRKEWRSRPENQFCKPCSDAGLLTQAEPYPHHKKGRVGILLCDPLYFLPVCDKCHRWIHSHPAMSYRKGYLIKSGSTTQTKKANYA